MQDGGSIAMKRSITMFTAVIALALSLGACTTVNRLDMFKVENARLAAELRVPPKPTLAINYNVSFHRDNPLGTFLSLGSNIIKASEATKAEAAMREALEYVDVPTIVLKEAHSACASALGARAVDRRRSAEYLLDLEIEEYGIKADSPFSAVSLHMRLKATMIHQKSGELAWRRMITVDDPASPATFGLSHIVGDIVTAGVLSGLSSRDLEDGFERLASETARSVARKLQDDLYSARTEW
jgi:hypothetical protein